MRERPPRLNIGGPDPGVPEVLYVRAHRAGVKPTQEWLLNEAKYIAETIRARDSVYCHRLDGGRALMRTCERYIERIERMQRRRR